jgi:hypothetical protein
MRTNLRMLSSGGWLAFCSSMMGWSSLSQLLDTQCSGIGIATGFVGQPVERWQLLAGVVDGARPRSPLAVLVLLGQRFGLACVEPLEQLVLETLDRRRPWVTPFPAHGLPGAESIAQRRHQR